MRGKKAAKPARQAPPGVWSPYDLMRALSEGSTEEKIALLTEVGIVTEDGQLSPRYKSWGDVVSRTADEGNGQGP